MVHRRQGWAQEQRGRRELAAGASAEDTQGWMGGLSCGLQKAGLMMRGPLAPPDGSGNRLSPAPAACRRAPPGVPDPPRSRSGARRRRGSLGSPKTLRSGRPARSREASGRGAVRRGEPTSAATRVCTRCSVVRVEGDKARTWRAMLRWEAADPPTRRRFPCNRRPRGEGPLRWPAPPRRCPNRDRSAPHRPRSACASVCHRANSAGA